MTPSDSEGMAQVGGDGLPERINPVMREAPHFPRF